MTVDDAVEILDAAVRAVADLICEPFGIPSFADEVSATLRPEYAGVVAMIPGLEPS